MIDSFKVVANTHKNLLLIQLRGFFMKSELELALYLGKKESEKLKPGYTVILDMDGMHSNKNFNKTIQSRARDIFLQLGASKVKSVGAIFKASKPDLLSIEHFAFDNVGFYPN